jgi:glycerol-3-phosphate acyltransferase PlsX
MIRIGLDMMGGDFAPAEAVKGIRAFHDAFPGKVKLVAFGVEDVVREACVQQNLDASVFEMVHTPEVIEMNEHPTKALREKPESSIAVGFKHLAEEKIDAFISAGNTGAMMVGALFSIKTIEGVIRPTIGAYIPREDGSLGLLLDVGLNSDCKPEQLNQFAVLGSLYVEQVMGTTSPRVGLLNLGEEEGKGNILTQAAYTLLKENNKILFTGNLEGRDILLNKADVMVCDGFTGNVVLKMAESVYDIVKRREINDAHFNRFDFEIYGGVPVLGVSKPVIIGHGISHETAFKNMILNAVKMIETGLIVRMQQHFLVETN